MVWGQRWDPLRREWVVISSPRNARPRPGGRGGEPSRPSLPPYAPDCSLCPGTPRSSGRRNESYTGVYVFDNDHPCVGPAAPAASSPAVPIYEASPATGFSRVVCYTPRHDLTLAQLPKAEVLSLLLALQTQ